MFYLDKPNSPKPTFIFMRYPCVDGALKYPVKAKVLPTNWANGRVKKDEDDINVTLSKIELAFKELQLQQRLKGIPLTRLRVQQAFDRALGRNTAGQEFFAVIDHIIEDRSSGKELTRDGKRFSPHTLKGYVHTRDNLFKFDPGMSFEGITMDTYRKLISFFNQMDHSLNSLGKTIKNWKVFMNAAHSRGIHDNLIYLHKDFRIPEEDTDDVYLDEKELELIYDHHYASETLDLVRDWFIIDCFTGLRISDIQALDVKNLGRETITIVNEKTDTKVSIPLHRYVKSILKKHNGFPRKITDQRMNTYIKDVCELAGITDPYIYSITKGGKRIDYHVKKYEMVSNHTSRRSFITNLLNNGIPDNQVMQLAGIKKHSTLLRYKKTKPEETAKLLKGHKFFSG